MVKNLLAKGIRGFKKVVGDMSGVSLVETIITLGIMSIVAVVYLSGMSATSKAVMVSQERVTAENLAKSQMEYIRSQPYDQVNSPPQYLELSVGDIPETYDIVILAERLDPKGNGLTNDDGLQKVIVVVNRSGVEIFRLEGYRMNR